MRHILFFTVIANFIGCFSASAQDIDAGVLLSKIDSSVKQIKHVQYVLHNKYQKFATGEDTVTTVNQYDYYYQIDSSSLLNCKFASFPKGFNGSQVIFDGTQLFNNLTYTGVLETAQSQRDSSYIRSIKNNVLQYPFIQYLAERFKIFQNPRITDKVQILGEEIIEGEKCFKIRLGVAKSDQYVSEGNYFIQKGTFLPIKYEVTLKQMVGAVEQVQKFEYWITDPKINVVLPSDVFSKANLTYNLEKPYSPRSPRNYDLLSIGSKSPDWELKSVDGKLIKSTDLLGKIVVMDFWFKSCLPCINQMIELKELQKRFKGKDFLLVSVNTVDDVIKDNLQTFLRNREITSLNLVGGNLITERFKVVSAPTLYVVNKDGTILLGKEGYSSTLITELQNIIEPKL